MIVRHVASEFDLGPLLASARRTVAETATTHTSAPGLEMRLEKDPAVTRVVARGAVDADGVHGDIFS